jgi:hypothetical protein
MEKNMKPLFQFTLLIILISQISCKRMRDDSDDKDGSRLLALLLIANSGQDADPLATTIEQSLDSSTSAMESVTSDGASIASLKTDSGYWDKFKLSMEDLFMNRDFFSPSLEAATFTSTYNCLGGGTISRTIEASSQPFNGTGPTTFFGKRVFTNCVLLRASRFTQGGTREVYWNNLATTSPYIQATSTLNVALNRTITDRLRGFSVKVTGNGATITGGSEKIAAESTWSAATSNSSTYSVNLTEGRIGTNSRGATIFDHTITTPTALVHVVSGTGSSRRRTVNGSIKVAHNILKFDTLTTFKDVVWDASTCQPVSGSATVVITGSRTATGTITFTSESASFSYSGTSGSATGTVEFTGCTSSI